MPTLSIVYPYPAQGRADRPTHEDEVADTAIRGCRSVTELYGEALTRLALPCRYSELRLFTHHDPQLDRVRGEVHVDPASGGFESGHIGVPTGFADHAPRARAEMLLEVIHGMVVRLAEARGWDRTALATCRQHVLDHDLEYRWTSPSKVSPDRRLESYADFRLPADGYGRVRIRLVRRGDDAVVATSDEALAFCTSQGFHRAAGSMRWHSKDLVSLVPYDFVPGTRGGSVALTRVADSWRSTVEEYCVVRPTPAGDAGLPALAVNVEGRGASAAEQPPEIVYVGGGPITWGFVDEFNEAFRVEMRRLTSPAGQSWWANSGLRVCEIFTHYGDAEARVRGRRTGERLRIHVDQPTLSLTGQRPTDAAREAAQRVVALVRRRTGLGPHPDFPST